MRERPPRPRTWLVAAGLAAAVALAVRGFLDLPAGSGYALLGVALAIVAAVIYRYRM